MDLQIHKASVPCPQPTSTMSLCVATSRSKAGTHGSRLNRVALRSSNESPRPQGAPSQNLADASAPLMPHSFRRVADMFRTCGPPQFPSRSRQLQSNIVPLLKLTHPALQAQQHPHPVRLDFIERTYSLAPRRHITWRDSIEKIAAEQPSQRRLRRGYSLRHPSRQRAAQPVSERGGKPSLRHREKLGR